MFHHLKKLAVVSVAFSLLTQAKPIPIDLEERSPKQVYLRVEGESYTIFEGLVLHPHARNITTASGGNHRCDGYEGGYYPKPGPTCLSALDQAAKRAGFTFDATYTYFVQDFVVRRIGDTVEDSSNKKYWSLLINGQIAPRDGCHVQTKRNDKVLWAFDAWNAYHYLGLALDDANNIYAGQPFTATVTDTYDNSPIGGAQVGNQVSDDNGKVTLQVNYPGRQSFKAERADSIRSNRVVAIVKPHPH